MQVCHPVGGLGRWWHGFGSQFQQISLLVSRGTEAMAWWEKLQWQVCPLHITQQWCFASSGLSFLYEHSSFWSPSFLSSQAVSSTVTISPLPGSALLNPCVPASSPCLHPGLDTCVRIHTGLWYRPSVQVSLLFPACHWPFGYTILQAPQVPFSVQLIPHLLRDFPRQEPLFTFNLQPVTLVLSFFHSFYFSLLYLSHSVMLGCFLSF